MYGINTLPFVEEIDVSYDSLNTITLHVYDKKISAYFSDHIYEEWGEQVTEVRALLQQEADLNEIVRLVGFDALGEKDRITLECARIIREDFLQQNAFREVDRYTSPKKQAQMLSAILSWYRMAQEAIPDGAGYKEIMKLGSLEKIAAMKYEEEDGWDAFYADLTEQMRQEFSRLRAGGDRS